jgi:16S rRNA (guanine527-N7)-methyltransferase
LSDAALEGQIRDRLRVVQLDLPDPVISGCAAYITLLRQWNARINLTALRVVDPLPQTTLDKLIVEPLMAAPLISATTVNWIDLGSGGGSPAIPLRLTHRGGTLTMVESRHRKCAFLRDATRHLELERTFALAVRFEELTLDREADLVSIRAVRLDEPTADLIAAVLQSGGTLVAFGSRAIDSRFVLEQEVELPDGSVLFKYRRG